MQPIHKLQAKLSGCGSKIPGTATKRWLKRTMNSKLAVLAFWPKNTFGVLLGWSKPDGLIFVGRLLGLPEELFSPERQRLLRGEPPEPPAALREVRPAGWRRFPDPAVAWGMGLGRLERVRKTSQTRSFWAFIVFVGFRCSLGVFTW